MKISIRLLAMLVIPIALLAACTASSPQQNNNFVHIHSHLIIKINGQDFVIPPDIGLSPNAHQPLHTHQPDGILHLEANNPTPEYFKLGKFFDIWGKRFDKDCIFDYCTGKLEMAVNGVQNNEFGNYVMHDGDEIVVSYTSA